MPPILSPVAEGDQTLATDADIDALSGTYTQVVNERLSLLDPRVDADNTGVTPVAAAMAAAFALMPARGGVIFAPPGLYSETAKITVPTGVTVEGAGYTSANGSAYRGGTCFVKTGNFDGFEVAGDARLKNLQVDGAAGNGGDGVYVLGGRSLVEDVAVTAQGGVGVRIGGKTDDLNVNAWRVRNLIVLNNGSHGLYVHDGDSTPAPNANVGLLEGLDSRSNGGDGLRIGQSIDCQFEGVMCATNTGHGVRLIAGAEGHFLQVPYTEANTAGELLLDSGADDNIISGCRSNIGADDYVDNGARNRILGRRLDTGLFTWNRLDADAVAVGASGSAVNLIKTRTFTWDPASIAALGYVENEVAFAEALTTDTFLVSLSSQGGYQIMFYGQCSSAGYVKVLAFNVTAGAIDRGSGTLTVTLVRSTA